MAILPDVLAAQGADVSPSTQELHREIEVILDAGEGQIRKWIGPPDVAVFYRDDRVTHSAEKIISLVGEGSKAFPGFGRTDFHDLDDFGADLFGGTDVFISRNMNNVHGRGLYASFKNGQKSFSVFSNIFVFVLSVEETLLMGALTQSSPNYMRSLAKGEDLACWYNAWSSENAIHSAAIYINAGMDFSDVEMCLYEEIMQTLGILNDFEGSEIFTFDNTRSEENKRDMDFYLLDLLYSDKVRPGDGVSSVLPKLGVRQ